MSAWLAAHPGMACLGLYFASVVLLTVVLLTVVEIWRAPNVPPSEDD